MGVGMWRFPTVAAPVVVAAAACPAALLVAACVALPPGGQRVGCAAESGVCRIAAVLSANLLQTRVHFQA